MVNRTKTIIFTLTKQQITTLAPLFKKVNNAFYADPDKKGMVIAQIRHNGKIECGFIEHERAKQLNEIMEQGGKP